MGGISQYSVCKKGRLGDIFCRISDFVFITAQCTFAPRRNETRRVKKNFDNNKNAADLWLSRDICVAFYAGIGTEARKKSAENNRFVCLFSSVCTIRGFFFFISKANTSLLEQSEKTTILEIVFLAV